MPLPFYILMGDHEKYLQVLSEVEPEPEMILEDKHWTLVKIEDHGLYWVVGEEVVDLVNQFMAFRTAQVYLFINYRQKTPIEKLENFWTQVQKLGQDKVENIRVVGLNFHRKLQDKKKDILTWCIQRGSLEYFDWDENLDWRLNKLGEGDDSSQEEDD